MAQKGFGGDEIGGEHGGRKALRHIIMPVDGLVEVVELDDIKDGREDFLFQNGHLGARRTRGVRTKQPIMCSPP